MKKILLAAAFGFFSLTAMADPGSPDPGKAIKDLTAEERIQRIEQLEKRVWEIRSIPVEDLDRSQRKALRKEMKEINREAKALQGAGIYISGSALLVLLLILLLI